MARGALAVLLLAGACSSEHAGPAANTTGSTPVASGVRSMSVTPVFGALTVGDTLRLRLAIDTFGTAGSAVRWTSSDSAALAISANGQFRAIAQKPIVQACAVSLYDAAQHACATLALRPAPLTAPHVDIWPAGAVMWSGDTLAFTATVVDGHDAGHGLVERRAAHQRRLPRPRLDLRDRRREHELARLRLGDARTAAGPARELDAVRRPGVADVARGRARHVLRVRASAARRGGAERDVVVSGHDEGHGRRRRERDGAGEHERLEGVRAAGGEAVLGAVRGGRGALTGACARCRYTHLPNPAPRYGSTADQMSNPPPRPSGTTLVFSNTRSSQLSGCRCA